MKLLLRLTPMVLVILGLFFIMGCEDTDGDDTVVDPLVGTWAFSNMEVTSAYYASGDGLLAYGVADGSPLGSGGKTWDDFTAMGVSGTVAMLDDGTFTLDGSFPISSDTLGVDPTITPLTDAGVWAEDATAGTLLIDGAFYDLGGLMTLSADGTELTLAYSSADTDSLYVPLAPGLTVFTAVLDSSSTVLGFTKQ